MCGICGILDMNGAPINNGALNAMTDAMAHRGPDGRGTHRQGGMGLGHRRLAILDLSTAGAQPMRTPCQRYTISYNGETYNYLELRTELEQLGHSFRSNSDTEVILAGYAQWGAEVAQRLNGMFAFAIWDNSEKQLFLARDRYGIKPLYYALSGNTFVFASEHKSILLHPSVKRRINPEALLEYFTFQNLFTDKTLIHGISTFPPGHHAVLRQGAGNTLCLTQYWDFDFREPEQQLTEEEYTEELDFLFKQAVNRQMLSDVEVGSYLSGGVDSGSITAIASKQTPFMKSFTCGFDLNSASGLEMGFDERSKAEYMSYLFKTEHYEMILKAGDMERCLPDLAWHLEEPRVGQSYPNYYAAKLASKFVKVVLGGTGGDELFGGYPWRYYRMVMNPDFEDYIDQYYVFWQRLIPNTIIQKAFSPIWNDVKHVWTRDIFRNVFKKQADRPATPEEAINNSLYFEAKTFLHGLLMVEDKLSMAHSLENRVPFLDNDLVDFSLRVPVRLKLGKLGEVIRLNENEQGAKVNKYFQKTRDGKLLLRKVMGRHVPDRVAHDVKQGFSGPDASWFKGESIAYVADMLIKRDARIYEYLDKATIQSLVLEHLEGKQNRRLLIWALLNVEQWLELYLGETYPIRSQA